MKRNRKSESDILAGIYKQAGLFRTPEVILGPGDDCAVVKTGGSFYAFSVDEMCEGTHFVKPLQYPAEIAAKLAGMNVSDLAAMGSVKPVFALCTLSMPKNTPAKWTDIFLKSLVKECARYKMTLAGGNLARSSKFHLTMTVAGEISGPYIKRSGAKPGDYIFGVGRAGEARAGLEVLLGKTRGASLLASFWRPRPCLAEGKIIAENGLAGAMIDNSDGLYRCVETLAAMSGCGAEINVGEVALSPILKRYCRLYNKDWRKYALFGGEDYGLVFTVSPDKAALVRGLLAQAYPLGRMKKEKGITCDIKKTSVFEHF
ncbi:MAG: thiamine-phosphate kinase [Elusimicrobiaceae bacterium]|jgi:thiamine-monophosphate kinase